MAIWKQERRFLVAFAEAVLGLAEQDLPHAVKAVDRLDAFLNAAPPALRTNFHMAILVMPPGLFTKWRFSRWTLAKRRAYLDRLFREFAFRPPGLVLDRQAILATVKSMVSGAYAELPEFWKRLGYSPTPAELPRRANGQVVVPPSGPALNPARSAVGQALHDRVTRAADLPERFAGERTIAVIGSGAGGLAAAHALALRPDMKGVRIVILEAGELRTNESFPTSVMDGFSQLYAHAGATPGANQRIGFIQGRCVGGGTTVNNAGSPRPINEWGDILRGRWARAGADLDWKALNDAFDFLEGPLSITTVEDHIITRSTHKAFEGFIGMEAEYTRAGKLEANLLDCIGCGQCNNGCRYDAHRAPLVTLLPELLARNPRVSLVTGADVRKIVFKPSDNGRAVSHLEINTASGKRKLYADRVILAAGAFNSIALLQNSNHISASGRERLVGARFSCNYASPVMGRFDEPLNGGQGIQIGYIVEIPEHRLIIETAFAPPTVFGMMLPQWGENFSKRAADYNNMAVAFPTISSDAYGSIDHSDVPMMAPHQVKFSLDPTDWARMALGLRLCAIALMKAGAREIFDSRYTGETLVIGPDPALNLKKIDDYFRDIGPQTFIRVQSAHLQGGNVIHRDPTKGVVNSDLKVHGVDNLWIYDSSVFPVPITLNCQYTTMALTRYAALRMPAM
jgi:choline dehydrogenase-like flavoprotein